jgi:hypothetical protein
LDAPALAKSNYGKRRAGRRHKAASKPMTA